MPLRRFALAPFLAVAVFVACGGDTGEQDGSLNGGTGATGSGGIGGTAAAGGVGGASAGSGQGGSSATGGTIVVMLGGSGGAAGSPPAGPCVGLECQRTTCTLGACTEQPCAAGAVTTLTGIVHEPAGRIPLYNVMVYVPNGELTPITTGATCDRCDTAVTNPVASAITDTQGRFTLTDVPVGSNIPLVIQVGKWRRQITVPTVTACTENPIADAELTRLPRNQAEGNIPLIAITTGGLDSLECLPRRMGIDDAEFTAEGGTGRIHLYSGADLAGGQQEFLATKAFDATLNAGAAFTRATTLWDDVQSLSRYDIVLLSCEGDPVEEEKPPSARQALYDYASLGGRVFASHWHRIWFSDGPDPVPGVGDWNDRQDPGSPRTGTINTSFPKGQALADWLVNVGASMPPGGQFEIIEARDNVQAVTSPEATSWITITNDNEMDTQAVEYLSFNTPLGVAEAQKCGRMVFTDLHVSATGADVPGDPFPAGCEDRELSAQEKVVMFMLFDLSSCIMDDDEPPVPPPVH